MYSNVLFFAWILHFNKSPLTTNHLQNVQPLLCGSHDHIPTLLLYYTPLPHLSFTPCLLRMYRVFLLRVWLASGSGIMSLNLWFPWPVIINQSRHGTGLQLLIHEILLYHIQSLPNIPNAGGGYSKSKM